MRKIDPKTGRFLKVFSEKELKEHTREYQKKWYQRNIITARQKRKEYSESHREDKIRQGKERHKQYREIVLNQYGKYCHCCGETIEEFLSIDHIKGKGSKHRKEIKNSNIYHWLIKNNFPEGFTVLCHNCNMAKGFYGECPHKRVC